MQHIDQNTITAAVLRRFADCADPRLKEILSALIIHLHDFVRETRLTEAEWARGIEFLTASGAITHDKRQEFILLSDTLGVSMLTVAQNHREQERRHRGDRARALPRRRRALVRQRRRHLSRCAGRAFVRRLQHPQHRGRSGGGRDDPGLAIGPGRLLRRSIRRPGGASCPRQLSQRSTGSLLVRKHPARALPHSDRWPGGGDARGNEIHGVLPMCTS